MDPVFDLGGITVEILTDGDFHLDGGAMFGVVPKVIWEKSDPPDGRNRIRLGLRPALLHAAGKRILVETGMGGKWDAKSAERWGLERGQDLAGCLAARGLEPGDIDLVILTHLHFDHTGGSTAMSGSAAVPVFHRARHVVQRREWEDAIDPSPRNRASYHPENFLPLEEAGLVDLVDGDVELLPGVRLVKTPGHTLHHQSVLLRGADRTAMLWGDLIPTRSHVPAPWVMGYDLHPVLSTANKEAWLPRAADEDWLCIWYHDARAPAGRIVRTDKGFRAADA